MQVRVHVARHVTIDHSAHLLNVNAPRRHVARNEHAVLAAAEMFVLSSHQENFGIAVAEALHAGLPVLLSDRVNIARDIERSGAGFGRLLPQQFQ